VIEVIPKSSLSEEPPTGTQRPSQPRASAAVAVDTEPRVRPETIEYAPSPESMRNHLVKKGLSLLGFGLMSAFIVWFAWPGITGPPAPFDPGYWTFLTGLFLATVALGFLVVVTWHERLPTIHDGVMELPFPIQRTNRSRTKRLRIDEIASIELTTNSIGLAGAELILLDRTRLFLPNTILGVPWKQTLEALAAHVNQSSSKA